MQHFLSTAHLATVRDEAGTGMARTTLSHVVVYRLCCLSDFLQYASNEQLSKRGGSALVPQKLGRLLDQDLSALKAVSDIPSESLSSVAEWNDMVKVILVAVAGLTKYCLDSFPEDLHYFWLE